ncbi:SAM-dependent methyltransferase [Polynucleobacter tropicus]|uniref:SAM-dependent methyltransferase n=1 Tax=Polynucleobacter tropicus TaxID=1743174 RepID=A0A6M9PNW5_9BURK|nr:class I SAM-dependent methyltransferase [Polynucleobacter tropicus]QKM64044.1 SAM-dependent methyltransferase [Polynucleobacter tropicus]
MRCRHCSAQLSHNFLDLGFSPPSNAYLTTEDLTRPEKYYPLKVMVCNQCWLVQTEDYTQADELFDAEYSYFSSTSKSWLDHAENFSKRMIEEMGLCGNSFVIEIASNDGYLLKNFVRENIPCLGIEPTASTAEAAEALGIPVLREFFGEQLGRRLSADGRQADLIVGNNVYAHVPNINDFTCGLKAALRVGGTITLEFPHLMRLIESSQFDTIYHEHFSYLSLSVVDKIFTSCGLRIFDVEKLNTHGGSLRIFGCHADDDRPVRGSVKELIDEEIGNGVKDLRLYQDFQFKVDQIKDNLLTFLIEQKRKNVKVVAYGAAAKGCTLLNYAGVKPDLLPIVFDASISKQNKYLPGSHIPIKAPGELRDMAVDLILILPWNIKEEVIDQLSFVADKGAKFVVAVPEIKILQPS